MGVRAGGKQSRCGARPSPRQLQLGEGQRCKGPAPGADPRGKRGGESTAAPHLVAAILGVRVPAGPAPPPSRHCSPPAWVAGRGRGGAAGAAQRAQKGEAATASASSTVTLQATRTPQPPEVGVPRLPLLPSVTSQATPTSGAGVGRGGMPQHILPTVTL